MILAEQSVYKGVFRRHSYRKPAPLVSIYSRSISEIHPVKMKTDASFLERYKSQMDKHQDGTSGIQNIWLIDSLPLILDRMVGGDPDRVEYSQRCLNNGRKQGIMTVASMNPDLYARNASSVRQWVELFPNRIFGFSVKEDTMMSLGESATSTLTWLTPNLEFRWRRVIHGVGFEEDDISEAVDFWIPKPSE